MRTLSLTRAFVRPPRDAPVDSLEQVARARAVMIASALLTDVLIVTTLRDPSLFRLHVLDAFAAINMSVRRRSPPRALRQRRSRRSTTCRRRRAGSRRS
ncbi:MAG: hypothetical protein HYV09_34075 [Deltaproteobacteria bacterium]|nr:hypothetical protein [Deltaproteobacteria bacterium]